MSESANAELEQFFNIDQNEKSVQLAHLDRLAMIGFSLLGVVSLTLLASLLYLNFG